MIDWDGPVSKSSRISTALTGSIDWNSSHWGGGVTIHGSYLDAEPCGTSERWNDSGNGDVS